MDFNGIFPPIATPFHGDDLDLRGLTANVQRWARAGLRGMLVLGSNGEGPCVDGDEAERVIATVRQDLPRDQVLMVGTGQPSTRVTIAATRVAARAGADVALVLTPFYFKSQMTGEALARHYTELADASPIPIIMYNMPPVTGVTIPVPIVLRLAAHPNIIGIKDSSGDMAYVGDLCAQTSRPFQVLVGVAPTLYPALCVGVQGGIVAVSNVFPELCVRLFTLFRAGQHAEALEIQRAITPLARAVTATYGVSGLKFALDVAGYVGGPPRLPLLPLGPAQQQDVRQLVERLQAWESSNASALKPQLA